MMDSRRVLINIAGRSYPLNVPREEEEGLRDVGKQIEAMVKDFERNFSVKDKQDALAMCALKLGVDARLHKEDKKKSMTYSIEKLLHLGSLLEKGMEKG